MGAKKENTLNQGCTTNSRNCQNPLPYRGDAGCRRQPHKEARKVDGKKVDTCALSSRGIAWRPVRATPPLSINTCYWCRLALLSWRRLWPAPITAPLAAFPVVAAPITAPAAAPLALAWSYCCGLACVCCWVGVAAGGGCAGGVWAGGACANAVTPVSAINRDVVIAQCFMAFLLGPTVPDPHPVRVGTNVYCLFYCLLIVCAVLWLLFRTIR